MEPLGSSDSVCPETSLVRVKVDISHDNPVATPIFQASAFRAGDPNFYTRNTNPNFREMESLLARLDQAREAVLFSSGMAAIAAVLHLLRPGSRLAVSSLIYGCTYRLIADYCSGMEIDLTFVDVRDRQKLHDVLAGGVDMFFCETPTNPFLETVDLRKVRASLNAGNRSSMLVVDNTWATPLFQQPLLFGADVVVYSGSKFFSGHSDVIIGAAVSNDEDVLGKLRKYRFYQGAVPDPFAAWLTRRSMQTLAVRMERHKTNTAPVLEFLRASPKVKKVYYPTVDGEQLKGYGGLLFFRLDARSQSDVDEFVKSLKLFDFGTSMAGATSAVAVPYFGSHLSMTAEEKDGRGLDGFLVRLSIGLEAVEDLLRDLDRALDATCVSSDGWAYGTA